MGYRIAPGEEEKQSKGSGKGREMERREGKESEEKERRGEGRREEGRREKVNKLIFKTSKIGYYLITKKKN